MEPDHLCHCDFVSQHKNYLKVRITTITWWNFTDFAVYDLRMCQMEDSRGPNQGR